MTRQGDRVLTSITQHLAFIRVAAAQPGHAPPPRTRHRARSAMGVPRGPVADAVDLLERHGVVVIRLPLDTTDGRGCVLPPIRRPAGRDPRQRQGRPRPVTIRCHARTRAPRRAPGARVGAGGDRAAGAHVRRRLPYARARHPQWASHPRRLASPLRTQAALAGIAGGAADAIPHARPAVPRGVPDRSQGRVRARLAPRRACAARPARAAGPVVGAARRGRTRRRSRRWAPANDWFAPHVRPAR